MMRKRNKVVLMALAGMMLLSVNSQTAAAQKAMVLDSSVATEETSSEVMECFDWNFGEESEIEPFGVYYAAGTAGIAKESSKKAYIYASTDCYETCTTVKATATLQQLKNGIWNDVTSKSKTASNAGYVTVTGTVTVSSGYYYRVVSTHSAKKNGKTETGSAITKSLYIN